MSLSTELVVGNWSPAPLDTQQMQLTSGTADPEQWLIDVFGGESYSGMKVSEGTILTSGPVYQAITLISSDLASLPMQVLEDEGGEKVKRPDHPISQVWNYKGNNEMLPYAVRQFLISQALIYGNGIGAIHFEMGRPVGVYPLHSRSVWLDRNVEKGDDPANPSGELIYRYSTNGGDGILYPHEVFHFKILGTGLWGYSPLGLFANTFGNGLATEKFQGKFYANDARPSGVLEHPGTLKESARANVRREWNQVHQGTDNSHKIAVLWQGMKWSPMSISNSDAQMLESRKFYREEVASIYNIPPHKLGAMENSAVRANIEEQNRDYVQHTLSPHDRSWSQECMRKLSTLQEQREQTLSVKHNFKALLRGDLKSRYDSFAIGRQWGWLSANDVLEIEDMDQIGEQGDIYMVPANMSDAETGEPFAQTSEPAPETTTATEEPTEAAAMRSYLRQQLLARQGVEISNLQRAMKSKKKPFQATCDKYYETFSGYLVEPLAALGSLSSFAEAEDIHAAVETYSQQSREQLTEVADASDLLEVVMDWPARIDGILDTITRS